MSKRPGTQSIIERQAKWQKENLDNIHISVKKGRKAEIEKHFHSKGYENMSSYIRSLIDMDMGNVIEL